MGDSQDSGALSRDVRALFSKANIANNRYLTFAAQKPPEPLQRNGLPARIVEETAATANDPRAARGSKPDVTTLADVTTRLRMAPVKPRLPVGSGAALAFASYTGGAGKTTLCATVARAMSARSSHVLVADRCHDGIIPFYFSLERKSAGGLQTVYPNARRAGYPMTLVAAPCDEHPDPSTAAWLQQLQAEASLTLFDLPPLNGRLTATALERVGQVIVPLLPDIQSVAGIGRAEELAGLLRGGRVLFVLNRFDELRPLHREIYAHLRTSLGDRLAPVAIRESEFVAEALSRGMTVFDHAPQSPVVDDIEQLAGWLEERLITAACKVEIA